MFFKYHPSHVITAQDIGPFLFDTDDSGESGGHAVVLVGQTNRYWEVKN